MKQHLVSKERVRRSFTFLEPDRIPLNYFANLEIDTRLEAYFWPKKIDAEVLRQSFAFFIFYLFTPPRIELKNH